ncbi:MAG: carboxypeptidase-like regulatory domain-containing protein, partial [Acidobacteria bacterium]|nr:carboxypeptidase-like regulatory domain-containing protein [Acidobacteriota bacterium]MDW7984917.1 carboxypeptidase-like regulatory domain-containing protein [Acidobacteriota bacterium]
MRRYWIGVASMLVVALGAGLVWGQARTGAIYGTVTDPDGNPLPGVTVELTSSVTARMTAVTDVDGTYRFPSLPPGTDYTLRFTLQGFQPVVRSDVSVLLGVNTKVDVTLRPGAVEEVVVRGAVPVVDVRSTKVATNLSRDVLQELPT